MNDFEAKRITGIIKRRHFVGQFNKKRIFLFGVSENIRQVIQIFRELGIEPECVLDNDKGSFCSKLKVIAPEEFENFNDSSFMCVTYSMYWREMVKQLEELGFDNKRILRLNQNLHGLTWYYYSAFLGKCLRSSLIRRYGNIPIFLCPYTGTGDGKCI